MTAPRRVLLTIRGLGPGGAERLLVGHARWRDRAAFNLEVAYTVRRKDQLVVDLEAEGVTVHCLDHPGVGPAGWARALGRLLRERDIDLVHSHSPAVAVPGRLLVRGVPHSRERRPALVYTEHNGWPAYQRATRFANAATFALDDHTLAVSDQVGSTVTRRLRRRVETLHYGVDLDLVRGLRRARGDVRAALGLGDEFVAIHVANYRPEKAHSTLLDAAEQLRAEVPTARILLVGQGPLADDVGARIAARGLGSTVRQLGFRSDVLDLLAASDALVLSSDHEGLPVAVMEALALGRPVVSTAVGGVPEAVTHGVEGLLVPPGRPDQLARCLVRLAGSPDLRHELGAGAARRAEHFDVRRAVRRTEQIYTELLAEAG